MGWETCSVYDKVYPHGEPMSLFFIVFLLLYGCMHLYAYLHLRVLFSSSTGRLHFSITLLLMVPAPVVVRLAEHHGLPELAVLVGWVGYCWMGFVFLLVVVLSVCDLFRSISWLLRRGRPLSSDTFISRRRISIGAVTAAFICTLYGSWEAADIRTEHAVVHSPRITRAVRLVQVSDVHLGVMIGKWRLKRMLAAVSEARPDIIVATGDLVDGQPHRLNGLSLMFRQLAPRCGMYAVLGNHEYYAGIDVSREFFQTAGFRLLRKEGVEIFPSFALYGVDDPAGAGWGDVSGSDESGLLPRDNTRPFTLLLKHRPAVHPESRGHFDLQLSGHVHKGQIFPFNLLTYLSFPVRAGANLLEGGSMLYVSRGTGTWGPPVRFLAPPEVTVIDIIPAL